MAQLDALQEAIQERIASLSVEYGAQAESLVEELRQNLEKVKRQKRLGLGKLAESTFHQIRVRHQVVRDSYINKNLSKLVGFISQSWENKAILRYFYRKEKWTKYNFTCIYEFFVLSYRHLSRSSPYASQRSLQTACSRMLKHLRAWWGP